MGPGVGVGGRRKTGRKEHQQSWYEKSQLRLEMGKLYYSYLRLKNLADPPCRRTTRGLPPEMVSTTMIYTYPQFKDAFLRDAYV